jgi:hypothetical protein
MAMPFKKVFLFVLLMLWVVPSWAIPSNSFIYTIQYQGTHSILIDFARMGSSTDSNGTITPAGQYYADYLSGPLMNVGLQENNYAYNGTPYPEGYPGILVVGNELVFESYPMENCLDPLESCPRTVVYPVELWQAGTELCIASICESGPNALITQKISTVPLVNGWVLFVSGLMTLYYAGARKRSARSRFLTAS